MTTLKQIIEQRDTPAGCAFDIVVQALIILSLVSFSLETLPNLSAHARTALFWVAAITVLLFTVEYVLRIYVASNKRQFIFSFLGIVDFVAVAPFYLGLGLDLRTVRAFRLLRLVRLLKLVRYNDAMRRFHRAFLIAKEEIVLFMMTVIILALTKAREME